MKNEETKGVFLTRSINMTAQGNRDVWSRVNAFEFFMTSSLTDFVRINPPTFLWSTTGEDT